MRIGRIILALLAPLLSFSPAVKAQAPSENKQPSLDRLSVLGLADFLRLATSPVSTVRDDRQVAPHHSASAAPLAIFAPVHRVRPALAAASPETAASLQLLARQSHRLLLRC